MYNEVNRITTAGVIGFQKRHLFEICPFFTNLKLELKK